MLIYLFSFLLPSSALPANAPHSQPCFPAQTGDGQHGAAVASTPPTADMNHENNHLGEIQAWLEAAVTGKEGGLVLCVQEVDSDIVCL